MQLEDIRKIALSFKGVTEDIKWENHLCFNVGGKMFLITSPDEIPVTASFKAGDETFELLRSRKGFMAAPYLARYKWIKTDDISLLGKKQWEQYLLEAYELIAAKLPKKTRDLLR